jgi:RNA-directed DNA polymerase
MSATKPFAIDKWQVYEAYQAVKANAGSAGVDRQSIEAFEQDLKGNLYKIWNRMSSGSYFPPPVKAVAIPKKNGGVRILGVPTVADRVAQMVVKQVIEPELEARFLPDSYGYRPGRSALEAVAVTRQRCWQYPWVLEFDIKGLFDNIDHALLLRALEKHVKCEWAMLYIKRWLTAPLQHADGTLEERTKGTPQGGVVSPVLANLFLHYTFDVWMTKHYPDNPWCRYADDGLVHCRTEQEAQALWAALDARFAQCALTMHPDKTKVIYCKDGSRKGKYPNTQFDFLGYTFRARTVKNSKQNRTDLSLAELARMHNPILRGWLEYYGKFCRSAMYPVLRHFNTTLVAWAMKKFKRLKGHRIRASHFIEGIAERQPWLFVHWQRGMTGGFA